MDMAERLLGNPEAIPDLSESDTIPGSFVEYYGSCW